VCPCQDILWKPPTIWIVDYDILSKEATKKRFYRSLHKLLGVKKFSSLFCYVLDDEKEARAFYDIAKQNARHAHLYKGKKME
jgi:hypothetical protein